jgi:antitoxin PrlF
MLSLLTGLKVRMKQLATLTSKGQITIPQDIRKRLGLKQGDQISFEIQDGKTILAPYRTEDNPFEAFEGALSSFKNKEEVNDWLSDLRDD